MKNQIRSLIQRRFNADALFTDALVFFTLMTNLFSIGATMFIYQGGTFNQTSQLYLLFIPASLVFFFRRMTFSLPVRFICYTSIATASALVGLLGGPVISSISLLIIIIPILLSASRHYREKFTISIPSEMLLFILVNHFLLLVAASTLQEKKLMILLFIHAICSICLFFAARQYHVFMTQYARLALSPTQPAGIVKKNHMKTILSLTIFGIIGAPLILTLPYDKISRFLAFLLRKSTDLLMRFMSFVRDIGLLPESDDIPDMTNFFDQNAKENKLLATILENIFTFVAVAILSLIVVSSIRAIAIFIVKMHLRGRAGAPINTESIIRDRVEVIPKKRRFKRIHLDFGSGEERKIRRTFYMLVKKAIREGAPIKKSDTPSQMREKITTHNPKSIESLTKAYEKTRYS